MFCAPKSHMSKRRVLQFLVLLPSLACTAIDEPPAGACEGKCDASDESGGVKLGLEPLTQDERKLVERGQGDIVRLPELEPILEALKNQADRKGYATLALERRDTSKYGDLLPNVDPYLQEFVHNAARITGTQQDEAQELLRKAFDHVYGLDTSGAGTWVRPKPDGVLSAKERKSLGTDSKLNALIELIYATGEQLGEDLLADVPQLANDLKSLAISSQLPLTLSWPELRLMVDADITAQALADYVEELQKDDATKDVTARAAWRYLDSDVTPVQLAAALTDLAAADGKMGTMDAESLTQLGDIDMKNLMRVIAAQAAGSDTTRKFPNKVTGWRVLGSLLELWGDQTQLQATSWKAGGFTETLTSFTTAFVNLETGEFWTSRD